MPLGHMSLVPYVKLDAGSDMIDIQRKFIGDSSTLLVENACSGFLFRAFDQTGLVT